MKFFKGVLSYLKKFVKRLNEYRVQESAAQLAYYLILSFFPFIIFLLMLLSFTPMASEDALNQIFKVMPKDTKNLIQPILLGLIESKSATVLGISLFLSLWSGSNGMNNLIKEMNDIFGVEEKGRKIPERVISIFFTIILALLILVSLFSHVFGDLLFQWLQQKLGVSETLSAFYQVVRALLPFFMIALGFSLLYRFAPDFTMKKPIRWKDTLIGGIVGALGWTLMSYAFSLYVNSFANFNKTYGSLGGVIVLLMWLFFSSLMILIGATVIALRQDDEKVVIPIETQIVEKPVAVLELQAAKPKKTSLAAIALLGTAVGFIIKSIVSRKDS